MFNNIPTVTKNLLIINGLFFLATFVFEEKGIDLSTILGAYYPESINFRGWQIITHMFMHGGFAHILFNMFALWMFGSTVEQTLGQKKFFILYFVAGLGAFALFNLHNYYSVEQLKATISSLGYDPQEFNQKVEGGKIAYLQNVPASLELARYYTTPMVGASGAIYGVLIAFGVLFPEAKLALLFFPVPVKAKYFIPGLIVFELFMGFSNFSWNPIANFAHLGGALIGFLLVRHWKKNMYLG